MENMQDGQEESGLKREHEGGHETNAGKTISKTNRENSLGEQERNNVQRGKERKLFER